MSGDAVRIDLESRTFAPAVFAVSVLATAGALLVAGWQLSASETGPQFVASIITLLFSVPTSLVMYKAWQFGANHLLVDVPGNSVRFVYGKQIRSCELAQLELQPVEKYARRNAYGRHMQDRYRLIAKGLNLRLFDSASRARVERLYATLAGLVAQGCLRKALASDAGAFRDTAAPGAKLARHAT